MAETIQVIRIDLSDNWGWVKDGKAYRFDGQPLGDVIELTVDPGPDEEAVYIEDSGADIRVRKVRRFVSRWEAVDA